MLENQFFPTPKAVANRMFDPWVKRSGKYDLESLDLGIHSDIVVLVLDPQAGSGKLLEHFNERFKHGRHRLDLYAAEIDPDLRTLLQANYKLEVVATDWLEYSEPVLYNIIISNPPFDEGAKHWLKSWEKLKPNGRMACLLNAETLRNPYSKERKQLLEQLALSWGINPADHGLEDGPMRLAASGAEFDQSVYSLLSALETAGAIAWFGQCFRDSERPTDVEVVCTWANKPKAPETGGINWDEVGFDPSADFSNPEYAANPLASRNAIATIVAKYRMAEAALVERAQHSAKLGFLLKDLSDYSVYTEARASDILKNKSLPEEIKALKGMFWATIFDQTELGSRIGSTEQRKFKEFAINTSKIEFNEKNITEMFMAILGDIDGIMHRLVVEVWDKLVGYHEDNRRHSEGWKTNAPAKIKKEKLIFPYGVRRNLTKRPSYTWDRIDVRCEDFFRDLDKALCWVTNRDPASLNSYSSTLGQMSHRCRLYNDSNGAYDGFSEEMQSAFFAIRLFKKGTVHLRFLDPEIAKKFAIAAAEGRNWIAEQDKN